MLVLRTALCCLLLANAPAAPAATDALDGELVRAQRAAFDEARREAPSADPALQQAATALARVVLGDGVRAAIRAETVAERLSLAGAWDPPPRVFAVRATTPERAMAMLASRGDLAASPATHFGVGVASDGSQAAAVLLHSNRRAHLTPFPRRVEAGSGALLEGKLVFPLHDPRVFVTSPSGEAAQVEAECPARNLFRAELSFPTAGGYSVEVVAESIAGPEVVALFHVQAGPASKDAPAPPRLEPERADLEKAKAQVLTAINTRRRGRQLTGLARSALLDAIAEEHAAEMVRLGYFAHVSPVGGDVGKRLERAGFAYARVTENLGEADSALEAHRVIEASPGHLANVLDPGVALVGLGAARVRRGSVENVILVEVYAQPRR
jgi:uncharacterized protein YkwD